MNFKANDATEKILTGTIGIAMIALIIMGIRSGSAARVNELEAAKCSCSCQNSSETVSPE